jgi:glucose/arabinose dehydrogenase
MEGVTSRKRWGFVAAAALVTAGALALAGHDAGSRADAGTSGLALDQIGSFDSPVYIDSAPRRKRLLFVVEQPGTIRVLRNGRKLSRPFLDITDKVQFGGEEGLLSVAFHPKYKHNRRFFVYYTNNEGNNQVDGFKTQKRKPTRAKPKSRRKVIEFAHPGASNHNGGQLQFGPDKLLYLATGDGGGQGDPGDNAQDKNSLLGKLLRIAPKRKRGYRSPKSNPFAGAAGRDEIYALGLRNPWRFSFDRQTGHLWIGDVGGSTWEEIDHETLASAKGANFGWDCLEGPTAGPSPSPACPDGEFTAPIHAYPRNPGGAVIGGFVVRDGTLPSLLGHYLYSDLADGDIRMLDPDDPTGSDDSTGLDVTRPTSFGEGARGKVYVVSGAGPTYRIVSD